MKGSLDKPIAAYIRVSTSEQTKTDALGRMRFQVEKVIREYGQEPNPDLIFHDVMSGKRTDRPGYEKLLRLIYAKSISMVVIPRVDRITRDTEEVGKLVKLFEKTGVILFECLRGRAFDFSNPDDWHNFANSGIVAERESRMLSRRTKDGKAFLMEQSKTYGGQTPFGLRRNLEGKYEPNPETWELAKKAVDIFIEENGSPVVLQRRMLREYNIDHTYQGWTRWLKSHAVRGHTAYGYRLNRDNPDKSKRVPLKIIPNTHPAILEGEKLKTVDYLFERNKRKRGKNKNSRIYPLSGLLFCGRCGSKCHIITHEWKDLRTARIYCVGHRKGTGCGGEIKHRKKDPVSTHYSLADYEVVQALIKRANELAEFALSEQESKEPEEAVLLRQQIKHYEELVKHDPDLGIVLEKKYAALQTLLIRNRVENSTIEELKQRMSTACRDPEFWQKATAQEKEILYREFILKVECNLLEVKVTLRV